MDGNGFEVDVMCVRTVYTLKLFCDAILFFAYIGLNGFASCSSKLCFYQMRKVYILLLLFSKSLGVLISYIFVSLK